MTSRRRFVQSSVAASAMAWAGGVFGRTSSSLRALLTPPPEVSAGDFATAIREFQSVVGPDWVFTSKDDLALYRDAYSPFYGEPEDRYAAAAVAPADTAQVQAIVRIANKFRIPLFPISTGKNLGYGGSAPNYSGSVVVDLLRMNRIIEVDDVRHFAVVEPGVSYFDLYRYIQQHKLNVWIDCPEPGWGSPIGNALDRGVGFTASQYRDHFGSHCGMEVVLPTGELLRTGMGAMENNGSWHDYKYGFGPSVDGLFSQGNLGIVTQMGFWLLPRPEAYLTASVSVPLYRDLIPLVATINYLENSGILNGIPGFDSPLLGSFGGPPRPDIVRLVAQAGPTAAPDLDAFAKREGKPCWRTDLMMYGPREVVAAQWAYARQKFAAAIPGATFSTPEVRDVPPTADVQAAASDKYDAQLGVKEVSLGIPNLSVFSLGARSATFHAPSDGHIWFSPIIPRTGEAVLFAQNTFANLAIELGTYLGSNVAIPFAFLPRSFTLLFPVFISHDPKVNRKGRETIRTLIAAAAKHGWSEYRTPVAFQDYVMEQMSFGGHAHRRFCEGIKDAIDPKGIMAPGRYGIWPRHLRTGRS